MQLKVTPSKEEPKADPPKKKLRVKNDKETNGQYGKYSGIVKADGKTVNNPTETEAVKNMANYMQNNASDQSSKPSNVYRTEFSHLGLVYDRKKKTDNA